MLRANDGRKLDHQTLEQVRIRTVEQIRSGTSPEVIARALGFNRTTIYNWLAAFREGGVDALKAKPVPGRPRKLQGRQLARLYRMVAGKDPRQLQFPFGLWTRAMVRESIKREFGAALSEVSVGRLLRMMGRLRLSFFNVAAKVVRHGRRLLLRLPWAYPHALAFLAALQRLRLLPTFA